MPEAIIEETEAPELDAMQIGDQEFEIDAEEEVAADADQATEDDVQPEEEEVGEEVGEEAEAGEETEETEGEEGDAAAKDATPEVQPPTPEELAQLRKQAEAGAAAEREKIKKARENGDFKTGRTPEVLSAYEQYAEPTVKLWADEYKKYAAQQATAATDILMEKIDEAIDPKTGELSLDKYKTLVQQNLSSMMDVMAEGQAKTVEAAALEAVDGAQQNIAARQANQARMNELRMGLAQMVTDLGFLDEAGKYKGEPQKLAATELSEMAAQALLEGKTPAEAIEKAVKRYTALTGVAVERTQKETADRTRKNGLLSASKRKSSPSAGKTNRTDSLMKRINAGDSQAYKEAVAEGLLDVSVL